MQITDTMAKVVYSTRMLKTKIQKYSVNSGTREIAVGYKRLTRTKWHLI